MPFLFCGQFCVSTFVGLLPFTINLIVRKIRMKLFIIETTQDCLSDKILQTNLL